MHKVITILILILSQIPTALNAQNLEKENQVKSLSVRMKENWMLPPIIDLNGNQTIEVKFDFMDLNVHYFYYSIIHCDVNWKPSNINESEYLDGFNNQPIEDRKSSFNTYTSYTHYRFEIPNDNIRFKTSGNYLIKIYDNNNTDDVVATARFSVYEKQVNVGGTVLSITDIDYNKGHQQLELQIDTRNYPIHSPQQELKVVVSQNSRSDNEVRLNMPSITQGSNLIFSHNRNLIFEAGSEFRRFEMVTHRYNGINVERIKYINPFYHTYLYRDVVNTNRTYTYDQDQNGRFFIRNSEAKNNDNESDYFVVHFTLASNTPFGNGKLYLLGEFNQFRINPAYELKYNILQRAYSNEFLLKQGAYNYQYIYVPEGSTMGSTAEAEGNHYETENEYTIRVYYRATGERFDKLIGYNLIKSGR